MLADAINMVIAELIYVIIQDMSWPFHFLIFSVFESASGSSKVWIKNKTSRWNFMDSTVQTELLKNLIETFWPKHHVGHSYYDFLLYLLDDSDMNCCLD